MIVVTDELIGRIRTQSDIFGQIEYCYGLGEDEGEKDPQKLYLLHGADWHFGDNDNNPIEAPCRNLSEFIRGIEAEYSIKPRGIVSTGDYPDAAKIYKEAVKQANLESRWWSKGDIKGKYEELLGKAYSEIKNSFRELSQVCDWGNKQALFVPGNHDIVRHSPNGQRFDIYHNEFACDFMNQVPGISGNSLPSGNGPVVCIYRSSNAVTVVFGFNSSLKDSWMMPGYGYIERDHMRLVQEFTDLLKEHYKEFVITLVACMHHHLGPVLRNEDVVPLDFDDFEKEFKKHKTAEDFLKYISNDFPIASLTLNARSVLEYLAHNNFNILLHGHKHLPLSYNISYNASETGEGMVPRHGMNCFSGNKYFGLDANGQESRNLSLLEIDYDQGRLAYHSFRLDGVVPVKDCARVIPLISANPRVSVSEKRLYRKAREIIRTLPAGSVYPESFESVWNDKQVVRTSLEKYSCPEQTGFFSEDEISRAEPRMYDLPLFLRFHHAELEILLNYHAPLEEPFYAYWDSYLIPAVRSKNYNDVIKAVRRDLLRKVRSWDVSLDDQRTFMEYVLSLSKFENRLPEEPFNDLQLSSKKFERLSPTWGKLSLMEFRLTQVEELNSSTFKQIFYSLPTYESFEQFWSQYPLSQKKGFAWVSFRKWKENPRMFYRNEDIFNWVNETISTDGFTDYGSQQRDNLKPNIQKMVWEI